MRRGKKGEVVVMVSSSIILSVANQEGNAELKVPPSFLFNFLFCTCIIGE
jgi:hypothetical protein